MLGTTLGPYRIDRELGSGGMGTVYAATGPAGVVAVKVIHPHLVEQPGARERFLREAKSGHSIASANVVRTIECIETAVDGKPVTALVLEFVEGRDLAALLDETGRVPEDLCRHLGREVARGLEAVHAAGIVHRDLKPGNVLMTTSGEVKVMDLGLARQASGDDRMSQTGMFMGTAPYAPPEQFFGKKDLDPRSDLYSLGAMLFELATGRVPFEAEAIGDLVRQVLRDKPPRIGTLAPQVTPFFEEVVATLLEKQPERRFATAAELGEVLDAAEAGDWWAAASVRMQMESRKPLRRVRVQRETELWGREDDLAELRALWDAAKSGKGAVVLLEGEAGIGKTRLVEELLAAIEAEDDAQILVGRHDPAGAGAAAEALGAAFRAHLGTDDVGARLRALLPGTPLLVPAFAALLMGEAPPADAMALTPESLKTLFVELARALAAEAPLVLVVDDLHFASDVGLALFRAIALAVETHPMLLVGTSRPGLPAKWVEDLVRRGTFTRREVTRLDEAMVREALTRHLGSGYEAESIAAKVASQAGGNPYFVVEALRHLVAQGNLVRTAEGTWRVTSIPVDLALPGTVRELVANRLAGLALADRELLEAASCQGHEFDGRLVAETLGRPRLDVLRALGRLEHATRLVRAAGARFAFDHHVVHEVLYEGQPDAARCGRHGAVAAALELRHGAATKDVATLDGGLCADLCDHFLKGGQGERALRYFDAGLTHLAMSWLNHAVIRLAERALAVPALLAGAARGKTLLRLASRLALVGRREPQRAAVEEALALARASGDRQGEARATGSLGFVFWSLGRYAEAQEHFERCIALAREIGDRQGEATATGDLGNVLDSLGRHAEAREHSERHLALAREIGDRQGEARATANLGSTFWSLGRYADALEHTERYLALVREFGDRQGEATVAGNLGAILWSLGRFAEAQEHNERCLALSREIGDRKGEANATGYLGAVFTSLGRYAEARARHERHFALAREIGDRQGEANATGSLGVVLRHLGRTAEAREHHERHLALAQEIGDRKGEASASANLGNVFLSLGHYAEARQHHERHLAITREIGNREGEAIALVNLGPLRLRLGDAVLAERDLEASLALCREIGARHVEWEALLGLGSVADEAGDAATAVQRTETSLALCREIGHDSGLADPLVAISDLRRRAGDLDAARAALDEALALVRAQGRKPQIALCLALLANLRGGDAPTAVAALADAGDVGEQPHRVRFLLWQATGDRAHLAEAKRLLDFRVEHAPPECRGPMLTNVRLHREIVAACREQGP